MVSGRERATFPESHQMKTMRMPFPSIPAPSAETPQQHSVRFARERTLIEEARREFRQGLVVDDAEFDAWLDTFDSDENVPPPQPKPGRAPGF